jgi:hypothetical protein
MTEDPYVPLWQIERGFWTGDDRFYEANLTEDALLAFAAPVGLLCKSQAIESVRSSPRWKRVEIDDRHAIFISDCTVLLAYRAQGWHDDDGEPYTARVVSSYARRRGRWMLVFHQHTPERVAVPAQLPEAHAAPGGGERGGAIFREETGRPAPS